MKQFLIIIVVLVLGAIGLYYIVGGGADSANDQATTTDQTMQDTTMTNDESNQTGDSQSQGTASDQQQAGDATTTGTTSMQDTAQSEGDGGADHTVRYTTDGFTPSSLSVSQGETVRFINETNTRMWVATDEHPTHANYDGTTLDEHCQDGASNVFDQCGGGDTYTFTFGKSGEWSYHNHLQANDGGTITVQ